MSPSHDAHGGAVTDPIDAAIARAHHVLPDQGPIGVFIHHNTLHAFQHLAFHDGVQRGAAQLGARPYLSLAQFADAVRRGRIEDEDLFAEIHAELQADADDVLAVGIPRAALWRAWMLSELPAEDSVGLAFALDAGVAPADMDAALFRACLERVRRGPAQAAAEPSPPMRHRDVLVALGATDTDDVVHAELVRLCAAFLDQGQAHAWFPERERGFLAAVARMHASGARAPHACRPGDQDLVSAVSRGLSAHAIVTEVLDALGVPAAAREQWLFQTALALPGFSGMFSRFERHPHEDRAHLQVRLVELLAVRLTYERRAIERACGEAGLPVAWPALTERASRAPERDLHQDALALHAAASAAGLDVKQVEDLSDRAIEELWQERERFAPLVRRRVFQEAYERRYRRQILDALGALRARGLAPHVPTPRAQFVFCIDEREESVRRALEEQSPAYGTFGVAGFFGVAIDYMGLDDHEPAPYAPVVVTPAHEVHERPKPEALERHAKRARMRHRWHAVERAAAASSRGLLGGAGAALLLGPVAGAIAVARVVAPRLSLGLRENAKRSLAPIPHTQLSALRPHPAARADGSAQPHALTVRGKPLGFSVDEAADRVTNTLKNIGLVSDFAPIIVFLGHGSTSLNNPHESAHDCGACGGRRGGANARLFAELANRADVREAVKLRGVTIPDSTWFIGALHDTASDAVTMYDTDALPTHCKEAFDEAHAALERARRDSALERCRRFEAAPLGITPDQALKHVEVRSTALSQPRPEYGHCTNAIAIVGRRELSRGLHLDRRPFLISYDPALDPNDAILERILAAVGPVGAGISLEYYFSSVDHDVFGCGTKLPHNVTGLLGIMSGHNGDLRTGLPLQMVEIHEPMRLLLIVEATPESLLAVAGRQPEVKELVVNRWVQLVSVHPSTGEMKVLDKEPGVSGHAAGFVTYEPSRAPLPEVERSIDWHGRTREHLPPALVRSALARSTDGGTR
jgi:uncharacterized protein